MTSRIETNRLKIPNEVVRLAASREDGTNTARLHDGDVAADGISSKDARDSSSKAHPPVRRPERTTDDKADVGAFAGGGASSHRTRIDDARPDRGRAPRGKVRMREQPLEQVSDIARATVGGGVAPD